MNVVKCCIIKKNIFLKSVDKINFIWYTICVKLNSTMKIEYEKKF